MPMGFQQQLRFNKALSLNKLIKILIDPVLIIFTLFSLAIYIEGSLTSEYLVLSIMLFALSFPGTWVNSKKIKDEFFNTFGQWFLIVGILLFFGYVTGYLSHFTEKVVLLWGLGTPIILVAAHLIASSYLSSNYYIASIKKTAVIVGVNDLGNQLQARISSNTELGIELKGFFDVLSDDIRSQSVLNNTHLLGKIEQLSSYVKHNAIDIIYVALPPSLHSIIMQLLDDLKDTTASIYFVPNFFIADLIQARIDDIGGMPVVAVCETPFSGFDGFVKGLSDLILAGFILLVISR